MDLFIATKLQLGPDGPDSAKIALERQINFLIERAEKERPSVQLQLHQELAKLHCQFCGLVINDMEAARRSHMPPKTVSEPRRTMQCFCRKLEKVNWELTLKEMLTVGLVKVDGRVGFAGEEALRQGAGAGDESDGARGGGARVCRRRAHAIQ
eukprot:1186610-Prorocentrum_minimum.AAC.2